MLPYRDRNPSGQIPYVTWALIALNTVVFLSYWPLGTDESVGAVFRQFGMVPITLESGASPGSVLTAMFIHGGWFHLILNMLFLYIFGDNLEAELGHLRFLGLYLGAGIIANLLQWLAASGSSIAVGGASGAIAGVMGGYLLMFPRARILVLFYLIVRFRAVAVPAWALLGLWFGLQVAGGLTTQAGASSVAFWAHIGGFLAGVMLTARQWRLRGGPKFWHRFHGLPPHPEAAQSVPVVRRRRADLPPPKSRGLFGR